MKDLSQNTFKYSGKKYTFQAILSDVGGYYQLPIDNNNVELFEYSNEVNKLYLTGKLIATDQYGKFDRFLQQQHAFCYISFIEHIQKFDGMITIEKYSDTRAFYCRFYIDNVLILDRNGPSIKYEIRLVSENIFRCISNIDYTNYQSDPEPIFDILKSCIAAVESKIDAKSFDEITSSVKLNYTTHCNDNLITITKYLLNKLYYYETKDTSLKMIWYDETELTYGLFDVKNKYQKSGVYSITLSFLNSNNEVLTELEPNKIGTVVKLPSLQNISNLKTKVVYDYDFKTNTFNDKLTVKTEDIANYLNNTITDDTIEAKSHAFSIDNLNLNEYGTYWNNDFSTYDTAIKSMLGNNALVINTSGDILRKPTSYVNVLIDRDTKFINTSNDLKSYKDKMTRYQGLEGIWFATRVTHIVEPNLAKYRQNLVLSRNFLPKFK